jgi:phosphodiesterase/alkaline phosphatase D-like protein
MDRRSFIRNAAAVVAAGASSGLARIDPAFGAEVLFADSFRRSGTSKGWGKPWFNQRFGIPWGIAKRKGFYDLPDKQPGAAAFNPDPVLVLDKDAANVDLVAQFGTNNVGARMGLAARALDYGDYYAAYLDGERLLVSRFSSAREDVPELNLPATAPFTVEKGKRYWLRLKVSGTNPVKVQAKVWKVGTKQPSGFSLTVNDDDARRLEKAGAFGFVFMHDDGGESARVTVSKLKVTSAENGRSSTPRISYAFAGRTTDTGSGLRTRVVAKTDIPAQVVFHVADNPKLDDFTTIVPDEIMKKPLISKGWLDDLQPGSTMYWRAQAKTAKGKKYRTRTRELRLPPAAGSAVTFAFGSCTHFYPVSRSFEEAAKQDPLFFAHLGDLGYAEAEEGAAAALRSDAFHDRWTRMLERPTMARLHEKAAWLMMQDDHDYGQNNAFEASIRTFTIAAWDQVAGNLGDRRFDIRYGDVHCFFVDTHRFADDPFDDDGPDHSLLGDDQRAWLKDGIRASDANLLVVFTSLPLWGFGSGDHTWKLAFENERNDLVDFFHTEQGANRRVLVCSGNAHAQVVNRFSDPGGGKDLVEFVSSGTDRIDSTGKEPLPVPNGDDIIDTTRAVRKIDAFGLVTLQAAGPNRKVILRSIESSTGQNTWAPLELDL